MQKRGLKGLEKVTEFIKIVLASGQIADDKPLSLMLVAPVSSGKTTAVKQFIKNKKVLITTDSTAYGILKNYAQKLRENEIKHIIIPDLLTVFAKRKTTTDTFLLFVNNSSEDGIFPSKSYGLEIDKFINPFGWILCVTEDGYKQKYKQIKGIGMISRFFEIHYKYSLDQINEILENICNEKNIKLDYVKIPTKKKPVKIEGDYNIFKELQTYSKLLITDGESEVLRMQKKLQTFLKANAYLNGRKKVNKEDLEKLKDLIELIKR